MYYCMTNKPLAIVNKDQKNCNNEKHLFRNYLQNLSPVPKAYKVPDNISTSIVYAVCALRVISVAGLKLHLFKSWADEITVMTGNNLHVFFGNYSHECIVLSKQSLQIDGLTV